MNTSISPIEVRGLAVIFVLVEVRVDIGDLDVCLIGVKRACVDDARVFDHFDLVLAKTLAVERLKIYEHCCKTNKNLSSGNRDSSRLRQQ